MLDKHKPFGYWTEDRCTEEAKKFKTRSEFKKLSSSAFTKARKSGWLDDICTHMIGGRKPNGYWTKERCAKEASKFKTRVAFQEGSGTSFVLASRNNWLDDICTHMTGGQKPSGYWTKERCATEASKFKTRVEFKKGSVSAYSKAGSNGWLDEICSNMERVGNLLNRAIYLIANERLKEAYIGLTGNLVVRKKQHFSQEGNSTNSRKITEETDTYFKPLTEYVSAEEAILFEGHFVKEYRCMGYLILNNEKSIGGLGGGKLKWDKDSCQSEAKKYISRKEFENGNGSAYNASLINNWMDDICVHMVSNQKPSGYWTKERCATEAKKYNTRAEFRKNSGSAHTTALNNTWANDICDHMLITKRPNGYWTKERCAEEAKEYISRREFESGSISAYNASLINNWMDDICAHMISNQKPSGYWTKERCATEAKKYNTRAEFRRNNGSAYSKALKSKWANDICGHMLITMKAKGYWTKERCSEEAKRHKTRTDFKRGNSAAYSKALKSKWIDDVCIHMKKNRK
jgi:predicted GIY-YIG superfamily endonuclease